MNKSTVIIPTDLIQPEMIPIELIQPNPYQPREEMDPDAVRQLAADIKRDGMMQVPSARQVNGHYELAFGHRRLEAYKLNGASQMPLIIRDLSDLQMFERGVQENMQRQDLNRIEEARAMRRYMDDFGKTSAEAAEFFGVSPEQIRATVRLLDLPPVAQDQLAAGAINIDQARMILSIQKVAPAETIQETVSLMIQGVDHNGHEATPAEIVRYQLQREDEVVHMWRDDRDGKPRSSMDYRGEGWLLSMKNFPNKLLPELTPVDLAVALGIQDDEQVMAEIGEACEAAEGDWSLALESICGRIPDRQDLIAKIAHLLAPPACSACPFYTRVQGDHYCGMKTCHDRKTVAWRAEAMRAAVKDLEIPAYDNKKDGTYRILTGYGDDREKLFDKRNKDLRLISRDQVRGEYHYQHMDGVKDWAFLVVLTGETLKKEKAGVKQERAEVKQIQDADQLRLDLIAKNRRRLDWDVALQVQTVLDGLTDAAISALWESAWGWHAGEHDIPQDLRPEEIDPATQRTLIALGMIQETITNQDRNLAKLYDYYERLVVITKDWKVRPSKKIGAWAMRTDQEIADAVAELKASNKSAKKKGTKK